MNSHRRTGAAALLALVLFATLGMLLFTKGDTAELPEPIDVALGFDQLVPGVAQVRTYPLDVPSNARVAQAGILEATGIAENIDWTFELCHHDVCGPIAPEQDIASGVYSLRVTATLQADAASGSGSAVGGVRFEQARGDGIGGWTEIHTMIAVAVAAVAVGLLLSSTLLHREGRVL